MHPLLPLPFTPLDPVIASAAASPVAAPAQAAPPAPTLDGRRTLTEIAQAVSRIPPEEMFELMAQMKWCVRNNGDMARKMLARNPQLAYALLQVQVVMRVLSPEAAYSMLHAEAPIRHPFNDEQEVPDGSVVVEGVDMRFAPPTIPRGPPMRGDKPRWLQLREEGMRMMEASLAMPPLLEEEAEEEEDEEIDKATAEDLLRVIQLTDEQISMLPPTERAMVLKLKQQLLIPDTDNDQQQL